MSRLSTVNHLHDLDAAATGLLFEMFNVRGHDVECSEVGLSSFHIRHQGSAACSAFGIKRPTTRRTAFVMTPITIPGVMPLGMV